MAPSVVRKRSALIRRAQTPWSEQSAMQTFCARGKGFATTLSTATAKLAGPPLTASSVVWEGAWTVAPRHT